MKSRPTDYVLLYKKGIIKKQGAGLSFFYYAPSSSVVMVPADSRDEPFIFTETSSDFQELNIQGQITYRVTEPAKLAGLLDFSVDVNNRLVGDGLEKLPVRLNNLVQVTLREKLRSLDLRATLAAASDLVTFCRGKLQENPVLAGLGVEVLDFSILKISPTPELSRALEAGAREHLLKEADEAVYERRNFAVEQERKIQENELQTQIAIEEKNRVIREEQMNVEIAVQEKKSQISDMKLNNQIELEEKRKELVKSQSENAVNEARSRSEAMRLELSAINSLTPEVLEVLASNQMDSTKIISRGLADVAKNAHKIGNLNISPDLLSSLIETQNSQ